MSKPAAAAASTFTSLSNVAIALSLADSLINRAPNLPGLGCFCGPSGYGKSTSLAVVATKHKAVYVACKSYDTKKSLLVSIAHEMEIEPGRATVPDLVATIASELGQSRKLLLLDDAHYMVNRTLIELVKDIYESSFAPIMLAAEERFPKQLKRFEQVDNRVLYWKLAQPCSLADARKLAALYAPKTTFADDWLTRCVESVKGVTRRVCTNIENARHEADGSGHRSEVSLKWWGDRGFLTGEAPQRRAQ